MNIGDKIEKCLQHGSIFASFIQKDRTVRQITVYEPIDEPNSRTF
jgi:hypothetical protein